MERKKGTRAKGARGAKKGEGKMVPVVEPVVSPAPEPEPDAWTVPETPPAELVPGPELPGPLVEQLVWEAPRHGGAPRPSGRLLWAGVLVCMIVIVGGWLWSLRYSLRLPSQPGSDTALAEAIASLRSQAINFGNDVAQAKTAIEVVASPEARNVDAEEDETLNEFKEKVIQAASSQ